MSGEGAAAANAAIERADLERKKGVPTHRRKNAAWVRAKSAFLKSWTSLCHGRQDSAGFGLFYMRPGVLTDSACMLILVVPRCWSQHVPGIKWPASSCEALFAG